MILTYAVKPNRLTDKKDKIYHTKFARWVIWNGMGTKWAEHQARIVTNTNFYSPNKQWYLEEDVEGFLRDVTGQTNNRVKAEINMIQIMGNQYVGNANRMSINCRATSFSPLSKTRKEEALAELLYWQGVSENSPQEYKDYLKKKMPIGESQEETTKIFNNLYVDNYVKSINGLLRYGEAVNNFEGRRKTIAESIIIGGLATMKPVVSANDYRFKQTWPDRFFFDRNALEYDLSDANYMGEFIYAIPTDIYESCPSLTYGEIDRIENYLSNNQTNGRIRVFTSYWRDILSATYGYVRDEFGQISLQRINSNDDYGTPVKYTDKDVVDVSDLTPYQRGVVGKNKGKAKKEVYCDQWRFCRFVPFELVPGIDGGSDVVLEYGVVPFQEPNVYSLDNMMPPFKTNFYMYLFGDVYSPVDIAINPQRLANRIISVLENVMNNTPLSGVMYDVDDLGDEDEADALNKIKQGMPLPMRGKGMPIQNKIAMYGVTSSPATERLASAAQIFLNSIETITGVNSAMKGQTEGQDQLVGVMQLMIKRGTVTQERFYDAIQDIFKQMYQNMCTSAKRFYIQNKSVLMSAVGDEAADVIELSDGMNNEEFRVTVKRSLAPDDERKAVDSLALQFYQAQLLDREHLTNVLGRGTEDDLWQAVREYGRIATEAEKMQQQQMQQAMAAQQQQEQQAQRDQMAMMEGQQIQQSVEKEKDRLAKHQDNIIKVAGQQASKTPRVTEQTPTAPPM